MRSSSRCTPIFISDSFNSQFQKILDGVDNLPDPDDSEAWPAMIQIRHWFAIDSMGSMQLDGQAWRNMPIGTKSTTAALLQARTSMGATMTASKSSNESPLTVRYLGWCPAPKAMDPNGLVRGVVDAIALIVLMYDLTFIPFMLARFPTEIHPGLRTSSLQAIAAFWFIEMMANFVTGFHKDGEIIVGLRASTLHYVRTFFVIDLVLVLCDIAYVAMWQLRDEGLAFGKGLLQEGFLTSVGFFRFARAHRFFFSYAILKPLRLRGQSRLMTVHGNDVLQMVAKFTKTCLALLMICHALCCTYLTLSRRCPTDTGQRWLEFSLEGLPTMEESGSTYQYFTTFHWAMSQITAGPMEYFPLNTSERQFTIVCQLFGLIFGSYLVSSLSAVMIEINQLRQEQTRQMQKLRQYLAQHTLSRSTSARVLQQAKDRLAKTDKITEKDVPVLQLLSNGLRAQVQYETMEPQLVRHPLFRLWSLIDHKALERLCWESMDIISCQRGDDLFGPGVEAQFAYLVMSGTLQYIADIQVLVPDEYLDLIDEEVRISAGCWLAEACLWSHWLYIGRAEAETNSHVVKVNAEKFVTVAKKSPHMKDILQEYSRQFHKRIITARPPHVEWPDDSKVPFTEYSDIVSSMSEDLRKIIGMVALHQMPQDWSERLQFGGHFGGQLMKKNRLEKEVEAGKCTLIQNESGEVQRVVVVMALKIQDKNGFVLYKIANWNRDHQRVDNFGCRLPGTKQERDEIPKKTLEKLLYNELKPFKDFMKLTRVEQEVEWKASPHFGIRTKYLRTVGHGEITRMPPLMLMERDMEEPVPSMGSHKSEHSNANTPIEGIKNVGNFLAKERFKKSCSRIWSAIDPTTKDVYVIPTSETTGVDKVGLYTWLSPSEYEYLSGKDGEHAISSWLSKLCVPRGLEIQFEEAKGNQSARDANSNVGATEKIIANTLGQETITESETVRDSAMVVDVAGVPEAPAHPTNGCGICFVVPSPPRSGSDPPSAFRSQIRHQSALRSPRDKL